MEKVVISGYYGFDNIGDDAMVEAFSKYFLKNSIDVTVMSKNPKKTASQFGVKAVDRFNIIEVIKAIKNSDTLISGGGTLLQDITTVASIWYYLAVILLGIIMKKEVYILFQGIGPIENKFNIWLTKKILSKVTYIVLRDNNALVEMERLGFDTSNAMVASDVVFALDIPKEEDNLKLMRKYIAGFDEEKRYLGVSLRPWKNIRNEVNFARMLDKIAQENECEIVFFPFHGGQDYTYSSNIIAKMQTRCHLVYDNNFKPSELAGLMSLMSCVIGVRLHSLVFATISKVPLIGISYDPKIDGFLNEIGKVAICRYKELNEEKIVDEVGNILNGQYDDKPFKKVDEKRKIVKNTLDNLIGGVYGKN